VRFLAGLLLGLMVGAAAGAYGMHLHATRAPAAAAVVAPEAPAAPAKGKKRRASAGAAREAAAADEEPVAVTEADLRTASEGDALRAASSVDMTSGTEPRDLAQDEIDGTFAQRADALVACITRARGAAPVNGRVVAGVVAGPDGRVLRTRVEAPAYLLRNGLGACARRELAGLRFPATGRETVVTVPFDVKD
jgi:hypothetical protein